jgi:type II restriction/modification system DNA methylase subunit YeeA
MDRSAIKTFATEARRSLLTQVEARVAQFGITPDRILEPQTVKGGLMVSGLTLDAQEAQQYEQLRRRLRELQAQEKTLKAGVSALIDEVAYTWFNRLAALRFMEVNGYCRRVLSSSDPKLVDPDLLRDASDIAELEDLPGFNRSVWVGWRELSQTAPNPEEFLYRRLLELQCKALAVGLPFLFDETYTALFMPGNLLNQDSIVRKLVGEIPEEDWRDTPDSENGIEIVGWLYQFYISERKDAVIGAKSKVAARDIPAATQLFTPHWIVRYMVENSLGRLWLEGHPESTLREKMPFYLESPTDQKSDEAEGKDSAPVLQLEELTVMDPACGSGHILVYAFDLLFEIYKEQGYLERDIPALILEHNLHGLDIDERAVQLASFAVLMKARAKNQRILRKPLKLKILTVRSTRHISLDQFQGAEQSVKAAPISDHQLTLGSISEIPQQLPLMQPASTPSVRAYPLLDKLLKTFEDADHLGSLISPSEFDAVNLYAQLDEIEGNAPLFLSEVAKLRGIVRQAELLGQKYWVVVANPPYMGSKGMNSTLKDFANREFPGSKSDLFAVFAERIISLTLKGGLIGLMTPFTWMFLSSYEKLRQRIINECTLTSLIRPEYHAFFDSAYVPICSFTLSTHASPKYKGTFIDLKDFYGADLQPIKALEAIANPDCGYLYYAKAADFAKIPGSAIAYWVSQKTLNVFNVFSSIKSICDTRKGMATGDNSKFVRLWFEVMSDNIYFACKSSEDSAKIFKKWYPYNDGGSFRKWYGNNESVFNWQQDGYQLKTEMTEDGSRVRAVNLNLEYIFKDGITWSSISSSSFSARLFGQGFLSSSAGMFLTTQSNYLEDLITILNSNVGHHFLSILSPTLNFNAGDIGEIPIPHDLSLFSKAKSICERLLTLSKYDWDNFEISWDFSSHPLVRCKSSLLEEQYNEWEEQLKHLYVELKSLETSNNIHWIKVYGLQDELTSVVSDDQVTIRRADLDRDIRSFISYAVGCMMGRYSLDEPGLIHAGQPFDPSRHKTFPSDGDAILPITDQAYFDDDIVTRFVEFVKVAYSPDTLTENLDFIANALELKAGETALQRIRRYFVNEFVSDHIKTYKKRPIYWLFTSGKKRAFGALVYLHRYTPDTVARLRTDYVLELQLKLDKEIEQAQQQIDSATSTAAKKTAVKRLKTLQDQQLELRDYQAKLQTVADQRITLDLDDGVAYNYTRFKGLVYEGTDLKMTDLEAKAKWKLDLLENPPHPLAPSPTRGEGEQDPAPLSRPGRGAGGEGLIQE